MSRFDQIYDRRGTGAIKYDTLEHAGFGADALPLWVADMDFPAPECVGEALRRMTDPGIYGYTMTGTAYNAAVTGWFERRFGWKPEEDWLVTTPGVVYAICTAIRQFSPEQQALAMQVQDFYAYLETVGFKLAHLWGFQWGNVFFPEVIPGYVPDIHFTFKYRHMVEQDLDMILADPA